MGRMKIRRVKKLPARPELEIKKALIEVQRQKRVEDIRQSPRESCSDESQLLAGLAKLENLGVFFAFHEEKKLMRFFFSEVDKHRAIVDGFSLWSPRDMFEYVHLPAEQREKLRRFKKVFSDGGFEWEALRD